MKVQPKEFTKSINTVEISYEYLNYDEKKKEIETEIEKVDKEGHCNAKTAEAIDTIFVLKAGIGEYLDKAQNQPFIQDWILVGAIYTQKTLKP